MAQPRVLRHPPIQEAVVQFQFAGAQLGRAELEALGAVYESAGWQKREAHAFEATIQEAGTDAPAVIQAAGTFLGFVMQSPNEIDLVQLREAQLSASKRRYSSWEDLNELAHAAFDRYRETAKPALVTNLSTRFINRIAPIEGLVSFDDLLERPPLTIERLQDTVVSDFLRRHVIKSVDNTFTVKLTIGTVLKEVGELDSGKALVIDIDVSQECELPVDFETLKPHLAKLRAIKNDAFFGSLKEAVVEKFA